MARIPSRISPRELSVLLRRRRRGPPRARRRREASVRRARRGYGSIRPSCARWKPRNVLSSWSWSLLDVFHETFGPVLELLQVRAIEDVDDRDVATVLRLTPEAYMEQAGLLVPDDGRNVHDPPLEQPKTGFKAKEHPPVLPPGPGGFKPRLVC